MKHLLLILLLVSQNFLEAKDELHAYTYSNKQHPGLTKLFESASHNHVPLKLIGIPSPDYEGPSLPFRSMMDKYIGLKKELTSHPIPPDDIVLFLDAFDTLFLADPNQIVKRFLAFNTPLVFGAERHCWPYNPLRDQYPKAPTSHRFVNSGFYIGYAKDVLKMINTIFSMEFPTDIPSKYRNDDQLWLSLFYLKSLSSGRVALDHNNYLVINTTSKMSPFELELTSQNPPLLVKETHNHPCVFHANGRNQACYTYVYGSLFSGR